MIGSIRFIREQRFLLHDLTVDQPPFHVNVLRLVIVTVVQLIIVEIERIAVFGYANFSVLRFRFLFVERLDQVRIEQRIRCKARQIADKRTQENDYRAAAGSPQMPRAEQKRNEQTRKDCRNHQVAQQAHNRENKRVSVNVAQLQVKRDDHNRNVILRKQH